MSSDGPGCRYVPGDWGAVITPGVALLVEGLTAPDRLTRLWELLGGRWTVDAVLDELASGRLSDLPRLALLVREPGGWRVVARPGVHAVMRTADGGDEVLPTDEAAVVLERLLPADADVDVAAPGAASGPWLPIASGVVLAGRLTVAGGPLPVGVPGVARTAAALAAPVVPTPATEVPAPEVPVPAPEVPAAAPELSAGAPGTSTPVPDLTPIPDDVPVPRHARSVPVESFPTIDGPVEASTADPFLTVPPQAPDQDVLPPETSTDFTSLFGQTSRLSIEGAALREAVGRAAEPSPAVDRTPGAFAAPAAAVPAAEAPAGSPVAQPASPTAGAGVSWAPPRLLGDPPGDAYAGAAAAPPSAPPSEPPSAPPSAAPHAAPPAAGAKGGDHDGLTVSAAEARAMRRAAQAVGTGALPGPGQVLAVLCPGGHPNPPAAASGEPCRVCSSAVPPQDPQPVDRPVLAVLRFSSGAEVPVSGAVVVGRAPSAERVAGGDIPRPVKVENPGRDVSRNHLEVRAENWHLLVEDLGSGNGTVVVLPDHPPQRLEARKAAPVVPGARVFLSDEVFFDVEVPR